MNTLKKDPTTTFEIKQVDNRKEDTEYLNEIEGSIINEEHHISDEWKKESHSL